MSNKLKNKNVSKDMPNNRKNKKMILIGVIVLIFVLIVALASWYIVVRNDDDNLTSMEESASENSRTNLSKSESVQSAYNLDKDGNLIIPIADIVDDFTYVDYGGSHQILIWKDNNEKIHTAFNTCQECIARGEARYSYNDGILTCSVCGNQVNVSSLSEENWGGCQPVAIPEAYRDDTEDTIVISAELLQYSEDMFAEWEKDDFSTTLEAYNK